jgi:hypothetical protein
MHRTRRATVPFAFIGEGMSFVIGARPESSGRKLQGTEA